MISIRVCLFFCCLCVFVYNATCVYVRIRRIIIFIFIYCRYTELNSPFISFMIILNPCYPVASLYYLFYFFREISLLKHTKNCLLFLFFFLLQYKIFLFFVYCFIYLFLYVYMHVYTYVYR